ncbi:MULTISPECIES: hypothetical protein [Sinorhizobium/Ensifer group]|uniref:Uncharacterized protein n=1 Tax=Sinorhizobium saheli TaxID=36856 RepID=A0A178YT13_SINSA|nr:MULTISPECIES: hypothetical protein [Sinorhizobium/Ensifer group]MQW86411.1 hypothetical protein [Sinorhizobium saheli]OAP50517.1 hypothetical protein ATB98_15970 [Sinorhizobium saheli]OHV79398.1 hypothetical protein LCM4579_23910 [Ensifer sp. LCM 4579]
MSSTTDFIAELIRAANGIENLTHYEVSRLLDLSIDAIRDMWRQAGVAGIHSVRDVLIDLRLSSERARDLPPEQVRDALIDAADVLRSLKIVLDRNE